MKIQILTAASRDLLKGKEFYELQDEERRLLFSGHTLF